MSLGPFHSFWEFGKFHAFSAIDKRFSEGSRPLMSSEPSRGAGFRAGYLQP